MDARNFENFGNWLMRRRGASAGAPYEAPARRGPAARGESGATRAARSSAPVTRSGLWLIAGTMLFAAGVLVWAFREETPVVRSRRTTTVAQRTGGRAVGRVSPAAPGARRDVAVSIRPRPPGVSAYAALLSADVFRPRVLPPKSVHLASADHGASPGPSGGASRSTAAPPADQRVDAWRGWKFNGIAQLSGTTYALIEQPDKRRSFFLKAGDRFEDATVKRVGEAELVLAEDGGGIARLVRVDAMAELLRSSRSRSSGAAPPPALPSAPAGNIAAGSPPPESDPRAQSVPVAAPDGFDTGRGGRRRQQFQATP